MHLRHTDGQGVDCLHPRETMHMDIAKVLLR
jgi:hypothetical protein